MDQKITGVPESTSTCAGFRLRRRSSHLVHRRNLCKKRDTHIQWQIQTRNLTVRRSTTRADVNKGGGTDQNKRGHLAEESEACWVIKERGDAGDTVWLEFPDNSTHCLPEDKTLLCEGHRHVGLWVCGVDEYSRLVILGNCCKQSINKYSTVQKHTSQYFLP